MTPQDFTRLQEIEREITLEHRRQAGAPSTEPLPASGDVPVSRLQLTTDEFKASQVRLKQLEAERDEILKR